jgi:hypothetical protein
LEKCALTKPLPPYKGTIKDGKNFADAEGRKREEGRKMETINIKIKQKLVSSMINKTIYVGQR